MKSSVKLERDYGSTLGDLMYVDRSLAVACTRGREAVVSRFRAMLRRENLSEQQWRVLRILCDLHSLTSVEIAARSCIHKVSVSRIIKSLEKRDMIERIASDSDLRASYVVLTDHGKRIMEPLIEESTEIHKKIAFDFGFEDYEKLLGLLNKLSKIND
jgi:homoprotocatechuate degradation regulator HpaR